MKKVAILHYAAPPVVGGVESTIYHHARLLVKYGWGVDVLAGRGGSFHPKVTFHQIPEIDSRHPDVLSVGDELASGYVSPAFQGLTGRLYDRIAAILGGCNVAIVHNAMTLHKNLAFTAALSRISGEGLIPLIAWSHDFAWQDDLYTPDLHPGYPWDLLRTAWTGVAYVAVSAHRRERLASLLDLPEGNIRVITPGVDPYEFLDLDPISVTLVERLNLLKANPLVLLPARITRRKNIQFAIRATAALKAQMPGVKLVITGPPGPHNPKNAVYLDSLKDLCIELGVQEDVHFLYEQGEGDQPLHLPDKTIAAFFRLADALIFPSQSEGFGIPVLEAGLARLPVFAADIPPFRESAGELAYFFDPQGDPAVVAGAMVDRLTASQAYRLRRKVIDTFTWQAILEKDMLPLMVHVEGGQNT